MTVFERYLTIWVALCILAGIAIGKVFPELFLLFATFEYANVNIIIAILIWAMVYPMMVNVDFKTLHRVAEEPKGLLITCSINWLVKPFTMALLGVLFFKWCFTGLIPEQELRLVALRRPIEAVPRKGTGSSLAGPAHEASCWYDACPSSLRTSAPPAPPGCSCGITPPWQPLLEGPANIEHYRRVSVEA